MPPPTYGADATELEALYFPGRIAESEEAGPAQADRVIAEVAGDVDVWVRRAIKDAVITEAASPNAWRWLTKTILVGAAAQYGRVAATHSVDVFDAWADEYRQRMGLLRGDPSAVLADAPGYGGGVSSYTAFV